MASFGKPSRRGSLVRVSQVLLGVFVLTTCGQDCSNRSGPPGERVHRCDRPASGRWASPDPGYRSLRRVTPHQRFLRRIQPAPHRQRDRSGRDDSPSTNPGRAASVTGRFLSLLQARGGGVTYYEVRSTVTATSGGRPRPSRIHRNTSAPARAGWTASYSRFPIRTLRPVVPQSRPHRSTPTMPWCPVSPSASSLAIPPKFRRRSTTGSAKRWSSLRRPGTTAS